MRNGAVQDVDAFDALLDRPDAALHLGDHAAGDHAGGDELVDLGNGEVGDERGGIGGVRRMPSTSVRNISFSAWTAAAISPATVSALML